MAVDLNALSPYKSLLICNAPKKWNLGDAIAEVDVVAKSLNGVRQRYPVQNNAARHGVTCAFFYYRVEGRPSWLSNDNLIDRVYELAMLFQRGQRVVFLASEKRLRDKAIKLLRRTDGTELGKLKAVPREILNSAYVRGATKTAWTTSTGRRSDIRADTKVLGGPNVRLCYDPVADQGYALSASVNELPNQEYRQPVGAAPRKGSVWAGGSADGDILCEDIARLLDILDAHAKSPVENPIPTLASDVNDPAALKAVNDAFAAALIPAELLNAELDPTARLEAEKWSRLEFDITKTSGLGFEAKMMLGSGSGPASDIGSVRVTVDATNPSLLVPCAESLSHSDANAGVHDEAVDAMNQHPEWLKVWYGTAHTLGDQAISASRFRHLPFQYTWVDFSKYDVTKEKPKPIQAKYFGKQNSLFCWVVNKWSRQLGKTPPKAGWLACNDGSMEIADFIHIETVGGVPELTLIHVKGCGNGKSTRPVAVGDFEVVVSQAQKNLYFLDNATTAKEFSDFLGKGIKEAVFHNGAASNRAAMLKEIQKVTANHHRRVVIVQPRITKSALARARAGGNTREMRIVQQLDLLLVGLQAKCMGFGAELVVLGDDC